ncbi:terminase small subunit [Bacillus paranthracis]|uniref:terminase small subunit n=1 Tax=Bacillus phage phi4B1 TaxID=1643324 RepID=UPI000200F420|nr:terminase small subunit [Bacillus paranthracis]YP_009206300.1 terminase small subunit [Bacillus phage phi4B1]ADY20352.1 terminase small subunit [Bacillus thuringiensis serovar finitimus YBT-020]MRC72842.1 terminase small subunit [Bacillus thuringiensis]OTX71294.1 terminase small subunit [Bacillus thuringiensis serovar finitimus]ALF02545.1 terminase small subunit [Bacillus phage phi4B1]MCR6799371.1 terminase small subunit [Bacillus paranthracis]
MKLTPKQQAFCDYYIETGNATEAYKKAGYKVKSDEVAKTNASRLLTNANVQSFIKNRMDQKEPEKIANQDEILEFLTRVMRGETTEQIPVGKGEGYFKLEDKDTYVKDRVKAAELLGKRHMMWTEKKEVEVTVPTFVDDVPLDEDE